MISKPGSREFDWGVKDFGGSFGVQWKVAGSLSFAKVSHLRNPLNENKPLKICRDGQEVPAAVGSELMELMSEAGTDAASLLRLGDFSIL